MSFANPIRREDPQALEKLNAEIEKAEKMQKKMKSINNFYRKNSTCKGYPELSEKEAERLDNAAHKSYGDGKPYPSYILTGNTAEIRRLKKRVEEISRDNAVGFSGWEFDGGSAVINNDICRLQLFFDSKPDENQRAILRGNGFHWSPSENAWQRQLNSRAIYSCNNLDFIQPTNGKRPSDLQPQANLSREYTAR